MRAIPFVALALFVLVGSQAGATADKLAYALGPGQSTLVAPERDSDCGWLKLNSDQSYEQAYAWMYAGNVPPYYGAFAECFQQQDREVCALVLDLTTISGHTSVPLDAYVWEDDGGVPGAVLCLTPNVDPGPIGVWPDVSRHVIELQTPCYPEGTWWMGEWGHWNASPHWWVAADLGDPGPEDGCPYTNIAPGAGFPSGWQHVDVVFAQYFGHTKAMGIGMLARTMLPTGVPVAGGRGELASWGKVKALYR
jgi:hypothetical protein